MPLDSASVAASVTFPGILVSAALPATIPSPIEAHQGRSSFSETAPVTASAPTPFTKLAVDPAPPVVNIDPAASATLPAA